MTDIPVSETDSYISLELLQHLPKLLQKMTEDKGRSAKHAQGYRELMKIQDTAGNLMVLANSYIQQRVTVENELDYLALTHEDGVFNALNQYFQQALSEKSNARKLFILGAPGSGKTYLLSLIRVISLLNLWPQALTCRYISFDEYSYQNIQQLPAPQETVLMIDNIDKGANNLDYRLEHLLPLVEGFHRVMICCQPHSMPKPASSSFKSIGMLAFNKARYPAFYLKRQGLDESDNIYLKQHYYQQQQQEFEQWLQQQLTQLDQSDTAENLHDLTTICIWLAEIMLTQGSEEISLKALRTLCQNPKNAEHLQQHPQQVIQLVQAISQASNQILSCTSDNKLTLNGLSVKEYLLVRGVANGLVSGIEKPFVVSDTILELLPGAQIKQPCHFVDANGNFVLQGALLQDQDLSHIDLSGADLRGADLSGANLCGATLTGADLSFTKLIQSNLCQANLTHAQLNQSNLYQANLSHANLTAVKLMTTQLTDCQLDGVDLSRIHFFDADGKPIDDNQVRLADLYAKEITPLQNTRQPALTRYALNDKQELLQFGKHYYDANTSELLVKQGLSYQVIQRLSTDQANYLDVLITAKQSGQDTVVDIDTLIARGSPSNASYNKVLKDIAQLRRMLDKNNVYIKSLSGKGFYLSDKVKTFKTKA